MKKAAGVGGKKVLSVRKNQIQNIKNVLLYLEQLEYIYNKDPNKIWELEY
jgi:hypothetical protein